MLPDLTKLLDLSAAIDPTALPAARLDFSKIPAKMAVYLLTGTSPDDSDSDTGSALLLATVGDLRAALQRRIAPVAPESPPQQATSEPDQNATPASASAPSPPRSKRIRYGEICTRVSYRLVTSPFEANWYYLQAARLIFPDSYRQLISWRPAQYISLNPAEKFPHFRRTEDLSDSAQTYLGPISDRRSADKLIETLEDLFDLCRYHHILVQAPHGKACAYKEMGKCPAPCDGTISLDAYYTQIRSAQAILTTPGACGYVRWRTTQEEQMKTAAAGLDFERAGKIKQRLTRAQLLEQEAFAHLRPLRETACLSLQPGPGRPWITPFFIHGGMINAHPPVKIKDIPTVAIQWHARCTQLAAEPVTQPLSQAETEHLALVAHHLAKGPVDAGLYLPVQTIAAGSVEDLAKTALEFRAKPTPTKPLLEQSSEPTTPGYEPGEER